MGKRWGRVSGVAAVLLCAVVVSGCEKDDYGPICGMFGTCQAPFSADLALSITPSPVQVGTPVMFSAHVSSVRNQQGDRVQNASYTVGLEWFERSNNLPPVPENPGQLARTQSAITGDWMRPVRHDFEKAGEYQIRATVFSDGGKRLTYLVKPLVVTPATEPVPPPVTKPTASFTVSPLPVVPNCSTWLDGMASTASPGATITKYEWDVDGDGVFAENTFYGTPPGSEDVTAYPSPGTYQPALRVTDSAGKMDMLTKTITVEPGVCSMSSFGVHSSAVGSKAPSLVSAAAVARGPARPFGLIFGSGNLAKDPTRVANGLVVTTSGLAASGKGRGGFTGSAKRRAQGPAALAQRLLLGNWQGDFSSTVDLSTGAGKVSGTAVASTRGAKACFAIEVPIKDFKSGEGSFALIGGSGAAKNLRVNGSAKMPSIPENPKSVPPLNGKLKASTGKVGKIPAGCGTATFKR